MNKRKTTNSSKSSMDGDARSRIGIFFAYIFIVSMLLPLEFMENWNEYNESWWYSSALAFIIHNLKCIPSSWYLKLEEKCISQVFFFQGNDLSRQNWWIKIYSSNLLFETIVDFVTSNIWMIEMKTKLK